MENNTSIVRAQLEAKERRQRQRKQNWEDFVQWWKELLCQHDHDYVGYVAYPTYLQQNSRRAKFMYNIDKVKMCPKCGKLFSYRHNYLKGVSKAVCKETVHRLRQGGAIVIVKALKYNTKKDADNR